MGTRGGAKIKTAGTSKYTAEEFFTLISTANPSSVVDTRLTASQLAGFARKQDFPYLVREVLHIPFIHGYCLAPTKDLLKAYRIGRISWSEYEEDYLSLIDSRKDEIIIAASSWGSNPVLVCSEHSPEFCHRRLAADFLIQLHLFESVEHLVG